MKSNLLNFAKQATNNWWTSLLIGILAIVLGVWSIVSPGQALETLTVVFICVLFASGLLDIIFAISNHKIYEGWGWTFAAGILDIIFGFILVMLPVEIVTILLVYLVGFWIMFRSIWTIGIACELMRYVNVGGLLILGILSLIFSIIYLISPAFSSAVMLVVLVSVALLAYGCFRIYLSFQLREINKKIKQIEHRK